jgi:uncharacterized integral membrane protein
MPSTEEAPSDTPRVQRANRLWFMLTAALVILVIVLLPITANSLKDEAQYQSISDVYDLFTGQPFDFAASVPADAAFVNIAVTDIDEARGIVTLTVSGNRACEAPCAPITAGFFSIGQDAARRLGLPPSAAFDLPIDAGPYTESIALPVSGWPQRYPFDTYVLTLGLTAETTLADGNRVSMSAQQLQERNVFISLEDSVSQLSMSPPAIVDPASVRSPGASETYLAVDRISWQRPLYLRTLTILLVLLIAASAVFALSLKNLEDLLLGIGGIILGVWGVRSIVVQTDLPDLTWVDIALALIILLLLLALAIRAARHYYRLSGFHSRA